MDQYELSQIVFHISFQYFESFNLRFHISLETQQRDFDRIRSPIARERLVSRLLTHLESS